MIVEGIPFNSRKNNCKRILAKTKADSAKSFPFALPIFVSSKDIKQNNKTFAL